MSKNDQAIRVLVVDDSVFMRNMLSMMLMKCVGIQVVGTAMNGRDAIAQALRTQPDVMTLDIEMPGMNGLEVLDHMMVHDPLPIIMVSALTEEGAEVTLQALERGAVDFIAKPMNQDLSGIGAIEELLHAKVLEAFQARFSIHTIRHRGIRSEAHAYDVSLHVPARDNLMPSMSLVGESPHYKGSETTAMCDFPLAVIGASTGGPNLLKAIIRDLPASFPAALLIVQHMPKFFTKVFAENLDALASFSIREAQNGDELQVGMGFVVPGDHHMRVTRTSDGRAILTIESESQDLPYRPSIDCAMVSAAEQFGQSTVGLVLTGMGNDGLVGSQKIKACGGRVLVQNEATSLIYGMPRAVAEAGVADAVLPDVQLGGALVKAVDSVCVVNR